MDARLTLLRQPGEPVGDGGDECMGMDRFARLANPRPKIGGRLPLTQWKAVILCCLLPALTSCGMEGSGSRITPFSTLDRCRFTAIREVLDRIVELSARTNDLGVINVQVKLKHPPDKPDVFRFIYLRKRDSEGMSIYEDTSVEMWFTRGDVFNNTFMVLRPSGGVDSLTEKEWINEVAKDTDHMTVVSVICTTK